MANKNSINKVTTITKQYEAPKMVDGKLSYSLYDDKGNNVGQTLVDPGTDMSKTQSKYFTKDQSGKLQMSDTPSASIELNKETGNIKIKAPNTFYSTQTYQEKIKPVLETISQNYKLNKDYKYALLNDENDTKTSEDWVKEVGNELSKWVSTSLSNQRIKDQVKKDTGLDLTDEHLIKMSSVALERQADGSIVQVKDDTIQSMPELIKKMAAFKNLQGWQNGEVSYKDLMESWNREHTSDEDLLQVYDTVDEYFRKGEYKDADEYAEMVAFSEFINEKHPETGFWRGAWDGITNAFYNVITGAAKFDTGVLNVIEGAVDAIAPGEQSFVRDYLSPELESQVKAFQTNSIRLNEAAGSVGAVLNELTPLAMQMAIGNALGKAAAKGVSSVASKMLAKTGEAGLIGAAEGMTAKQVATAALNGTNFLMRVMSANKANGLVASAVGTLKAAQAATAVVSTTTDLAAQIIIDVTVQDSKLARQLIDGNVSNEVKEYVLEQIALDAGGWGVAAGAIKTVKGVSNSDVGRVANAAIVPRVNKWVAKVGEYTDTIKTNMFHAGDKNWNKTKADRLRNRLEVESPEGWKRNRLENQIGAAERRQQNLQARRTERLARRAVGELPGVTEGASSWTDIVKNANEIKKESDEYFTAAHALADRVYKGDISARVTRIKTDVPPLTTALDNYTSQLTRVLRAEDAASLKRAGKAIEVGEGRVLSQISKESNEYVLGSYRAKLGESAKRVVEKEGGDIRGIQQEIDYYTKATADFREKYPELAAELDKLLELGKNVSYSTQDARVFEGVLTQAELDSRRGSEYFEHGYLRTQRVQEWESYHKRGGELEINRLRDDQHLKWGFEGDAPDEYQDITFVLFDDINQVAKQSIRKEEIGYLRQLGELVEVEVSGEEVALAKSINPVKAKTAKKIQTTTNNVVRDMDSSMFNNVFEFKEAKSAISTARAAVIEQGTKISKAKVRAQKISNSRIKNIIKDSEYGFNDDIVAPIVEDHFGKSIIDFSESEWDDFIENAPSAVKNAITEKMRGVQYLDTEYGELAKSSLPKIRTSTYTAATGLTYKDAPSWLKPYLSEKNGLPMDEVLSNLGSDYDYFVNQERVGNAWEQVENLYERVLDRSTRSGLSFDDWQNFLRNGGASDVDDINRAILANNYGNIWDDNDQFVREMVGNMEREKDIFDAKTLYAKNVQELEKLKEELNLPGMTTDLNQQMDEVIDDIIATNRADADIAKTLSTLDDSDDIVEYATLKSLTEKENIEKTKNKLYSAAKDEYNKILTANNKVEKDGKAIKKMSGSQINRSAEQWARQTVDWYEERVNQRFNQVVNRLRESGNDIVDYKDLFGRIDAINEEITGVKKMDDIVKTYDDMGREEYVRLSPTVADLITTMPTPLRRGMFGEIQAEFVKVFRMGTTGGLVPQSLIRQWFRDSGLAFAAGDVTRTSEQVEIQLTKVYGSTITDYYKQYMPDMWQTLLNKADETGESVEKLAARQEMARARTYTGDELQSNLYRLNRQTRIARNQDGVYDESVFNGIRNKLEEAMSKTEKLNNVRETNRRVWVYNNAYLSALNSGHSVPMARRYAEMIQAEATTNFSRQSYHLANLTHTVPYLGSAINGSKSFWRLMSMDPVGVTTRIVGGYLIPMIALTNLSISDPENRAVYKSIPEYEKDDNLVFVMSGQKISIPIPQEISSLLRPIQSWIETMAGANDHSLEELTANNIAGFFPYELQGFVNVDSDRILVDDVFEDVWQNHLMSGFSMLSSQMMGPLVKSGVMAVTGYDPYTKKRIDTAYTTVDPLTGESVVIDYKSGELAKALGNIFKGRFNLSADMAQAVFNNLLGSGNMNIIDGLSEIAAAVPTEQGIGSGLSQAAQRISEAAIRPLAINNYGEKSNQAWKRATSQLYREKEGIINDPEYQADLKALSQDTLTEEAKNKVLSRIKTKKEEFQEKVLQATKNLIKNYDGGTIDRYKFAAVISLMTFSNGYSQDPTDPLAKKQNKEQYQLARAKAVETMAQMGFDSPSDKSIFGYYEKDDKTGEIAVQFYSPLAILDFESSTRLQSDVALANIQTIVNDASLWDAHDYMKKQIDAIRGSKKKLSKQDYANMDAVYINWNAQVAKTLAPYVNKMSAEAAINNSDVRDYLYSLIEVPNSWEKDNSGKGVSLGSKGNKKKAYYDSWVKTLFSVNDKYKGQY